MNKKIKELAEEFRINFSIDENSRYGIHWDNVDEFAELIVRECLDITSKVRKNPYIPDGDQAGKINREIKKHFGVE